MKLEWDCIRFTRTVAWAARDTQEERLTDYEALATWCEGRELVSAAWAREARRRARAAPEKARAVVEDARALRRTVYRTLRAVGTGELPDPGVLEELNGYLCRFQPSRRLVASAAGIGWTWHLDPQRLDDLLGPLAFDTSDLLTSPEAERVTLCAADDCGWLFIDGSRNRSRRWCDMADCGNRAKVRRFRSRKRGDA